MLASGNFLFGVVYNFNCNHVSIHIEFFSQCWAVRPGPLIPVYPILGQDLAMKGKIPV